MNNYAHITIHPLCSSTQEKRYLLCSHGRYYETCFPIVELLTELQHCDTREEAVASFVGKKGGKYNEKQVEVIIEKFIAPLLVDEKGVKPTFLYEKELLSTSTVDMFSDMFRFLFHKVYMWTFFIVVLAMDIYFFWNTEDLLVFDNQINAYTIVGLFVFMLFSSFFHELGHASACKYFGVKHGGVGFGMYLNFPVLYTDVTEVWKLERGQRCIVNIAGIYFQSFALGILLILFFVTEDDILRYLILIINIGFLMTLNPFFKFDGYWIVSDILRVPNLRIRSRELIVYLYRLLLHRPIGKRPYLLQLKPLEKYGLMIYSVVVNLFMGYYFFYIIPEFFHRFMLSFPEEVKELVLYLSNRVSPPFALLRNIGMQVFFLVMLGYFFYNLILSVLKRYAKR